jgi:hypothetical protein
VLGRDLKHIAIGRATLHALMESAKALSLALSDPWIFAIL